CGRCVRAPMRLVTIRRGQHTRAGRLVDDRVVELPFADVGELLRSPDWRAAAEDGDSSFELESVDLAPVVPSPNKIVCLGLNYRSHIIKINRNLSELTTLYDKFELALVCSYDPIILSAAHNTPACE